MVTLHSPDGRILADVSSNTETVIHRLLHMPDRPGFRFSQRKHTATITLKSDKDVSRVVSSLYDDFSETEE